MKKVKIETIGDLRKAIEGLPDSALLNFGSKKYGFEIDAIGVDNLGEILSVGFTSSELTEALDPSTYEKLSQIEIENALENRRLEAEDDSEEDSEVDFIDLTEEEITALSDELEDSYEFGKAMSEVGETAELILGRFISNKNK